MRRMLTLTIILLALQTPARGQGLRDLITDLFIFAPGLDPLVLPGNLSETDPVFLTHAHHFVPMAVGPTSQNLELVVSFLTGALGTAIADVPIAASNSRRAFRFERGAPVSETTSPGPIFSERATTLGRGRILVAFNVNQFWFESLRGTELNRIQLVFPHENVDYPGCDEIFDNDCTLYGVPLSDADIILFNLDLGISTTLYTLGLTYGLSESVDVGLVVPYVSTSLMGHGRAQLLTTLAPTQAHYFGGTPTDPVLTTTTSSSGSASGLGDVAARIKFELPGPERLHFGLVTEVRFPTGNEEDLLGSGSLAWRILGVASAQLASVEPHINVGYLHRNAEASNDAILATIGLAQPVTTWATLATDVITQIQLGPSSYQVPPDIVIDQPPMELSTTNIPDMRDHLVSLAVGMKIAPTRRMRVVANSIVPVSVGGLRPRVAWTVGLEYAF